MKKVIEILEEVKISQSDHDVVLEKGDRIEVLKEGSPKQEAVHLSPSNIQIAIDAYNKAVDYGEDRVVDWAMENLGVEVSEDIWGLNSKGFNQLWDNLVRYKFL